MAEITPMMRQYLEIKEQNKDAILFFRLGDFYEMFNEDAKLVSQELDLTLTTRDRGKPEEERVPMCGVPYHSSGLDALRLIHMKCGAIRTLDLLFHRSSSYGKTDGSTPLTGRQPKLE